MDKPLDTGHKLNVHKTFRRRPGRLLNVLCKFKLRPVSRGKATHHSTHFVRETVNLVPFILREFGFQR